MNDRTEIDRHTSCQNPLQRELKAYLDGELGVVRSSMVRRHIKKCEDCRSSLGEFSMVSMKFRSLNPVRPPANLTSRILRVVNFEQVSASRSKPTALKPTLAGAMVLASAAGALVLARFAHVDGSRVTTASSVPHSTNMSRFVSSSPPPSKAPTVQEGASIAQRQVIKIPPDPTSLEADRLTSEFFKSEAGKSLLFASTNSVQKRHSTTSSTIQVAMAIPQTATSLHLLNKYITQLGGAEITVQEHGILHGSEANSLLLRVPIRSLAMLAHGLRRMDAGLTPVDSEAPTAASAHPSKAAIRKVAYPVMLRSPKTRQGVKTAVVTSSPSTKTPRTHGKEMALVRIFYVPSK